ncbi:MAG TPA: WYL domain-containing protein, partial [Pengzhenrongella sp.]
MAERASDRLLRMLGMITYLDRQAGVPVERLADQFGVSTRQVVADIDTLWVTGTPGYWPHDLIDFDAASYDEGVVRLVESRGMTRPLRLGTREAVALIAALRAMRAVLPPSLDSARSAVLTSVLDKLTAAT